MWKMESTFPDSASSVMALITERDPGYMIINYEYWSVH